MHGRWRGRLEEAVAMANLATSWRLCTSLAWVGLLLMILSFSLPIAEAQSANSFLSIDCGATANYTDKGTGIAWISDEFYINTGNVSTNVTTEPQGVNSPWLHSLRYFSGNQSKFCYALPATNGTTYLVRATFLYGDYDGGARSNVSFHLQIDTSNVGLVRPNNVSSSLESVIEVIMSAVSSTIHVCLAPSAPGNDVPFINAMELRELGPRMYPKARQGYVMITSYRYNFGGDQNLRYPDDDYDRLWRSYPSSNAKGARKLVASSGYNVEVKNAYTRDEAPVAVLNTALTWSRNTTFTFPLNVSGGRNYVVLLWFAEIESGAQLARREFEVGVGGNWQGPINVLTVTKAIEYQAYEWGYASIVLSGTSTIAFRATSRSSRGPILNAMEVYELSDPVQPRTNTQDVAAIEAIKSHWPNLNAWTGDPCLADPYDWTSCPGDTTPRITMLKLNGYNLTGSVPATAILNLTELTVLSLRNNFLNGPVPDLSALQKMEHLHLQNNNFVGEFPAWVANLTNLQELFVEGNNLTGYVPESLINNANLKFTYTPTLGLCTGASPALCSTPLSPEISTPAAAETKSSKLAIILASVGGVLGLMILIGIILCFWRCKQRLFHFNNSVSSRQLLKADAEKAFASTAKFQTMAYTFKEVKEATNNFENQIYEGSFGPVYTGTLSDGREVAVKRCRPCNKQEATAFFNEVEILARIHHRNLAALVGFCKDADEQILLYEYLSNSDLWTHLHGDGKHLPWSTRLSIALDVALGIEYLHTGCIPSIIHRDVQPRNILLTRNMTAKVANFAFAKFTSEQDPSFQVLSIVVKGTAGYLDPEFALSRHLSDKSDVYSFGLVLLELVSGQQPINKTARDRSPLLIEWMRPLLASEDIQAVVDPSLESNYNDETMWRVAELGMMCVEPRPFNRPSMAEVVQELQEAITMEGRTHPSLMTPVSPRSPSPISGPLQNHHNSCITTTMYH